MSILSSTPRAPRSEERLLPTNRLDSPLLPRARCNPGDRFGVCDAGLSLLVVAVLMDEQAVPWIRYDYYREPRDHSHS